MIFTINLAEQRYVLMCVRGGVMSMRSLYLAYDVALCRNTVRNVALIFRMVGHPWYRVFSRKKASFACLMSTHNRISLTAFGTTISQMIWNATYWLTLRSNFFVNWYFN